MGTLLTCDDGAQPPWCPTTTDEILPSILASLPTGVAWEGDRKIGTTKNKFWRAVAELVAWTYKTICEYEQEFYCDTANLSLDQWARAWALGESCDPYAYNLCAKVTALGGQNYAFFEALAAKSGYVIKCSDVDIPEPIAGCFECGCTPLGPRPIYIGNGSNLGYGAFNLCNYGEVVQHPDPEFWDTDKQSNSDLRCPVPGSNLGNTSGDPDCCMICGYYEKPDVPAITTPSDACNGQGVLLSLPPVNDVLAPDIKLGICDSSGSYSEYGHAYVWNVRVDVPASSALQGYGDIDPDELISAAGNMIAGCTPLCAPDDARFIICLLEKIKPAHTEILYEVVL